MKDPLLFEFEDIRWFPSVLRDSMTDYLRQLFALTRFYEPVAPILAQAMHDSGADGVVDLCSGSGGPVKEVRSSLAAILGREVRVVLTDKYPNMPAWQLLKERSGSDISYRTESIDAAAVPANLDGLRTMFSGFHHFSEADAIRVLKNAVDARQAIAIFDGADRSPVTMLLMLLVHPVAFIFLTPFMKPMRFSRIAFTYFLPIIPLCTVWDGLVSVLRLHSPEKMMRMARIAGCSDYTWKTGKVRNRLGLNISFLVGYPAKNEA
jgi:hypothetical protein